MAHYDSLTIVDATFTEIGTGTVYSTNLLLVAETPPVQSNYEAVVDFAAAGYVTGGGGTTISYPPQVWY